MIRLHIGEYRFAVMPQALRTELQPCQQERITENMERFELLGPDFLLLALKWPELSQLPTQRYTPNGEYQYANDCWVETILSTGENNVS